MTSDAAATHTLVLRSLHDVTLANYRAIVQSRCYWAVLPNAALLAVASTMLALVLCTPAVLYIEQGRG